MQPDAERSLRYTPEESQFTPPPGEAGACPWLGLASDATVMLSVPSDMHICHAIDPVRTPRLDYQASYCLSGNHLRCATYQAAARRPQPGLPPAPVIARSAARARRGPHWFLIGAGTVLAGVLIFAIVVLDLPGRRPAEAPQTAVSTTLPVGGPPSLDQTLTPTPTPTEQAAAALLLPTPTPHVATSPVAVANTVGGQPQSSPSTLAISPSGDDVGWWRSGESGEYALGDSFLNVGQLGGDTLVSALRLPLTALARGAPLLAGWLELSGLNADRLDPNLPATWLVQLIAERQLSDLDGATFMMVFSAPNSITLPVLRAADLSADGVNRIELDANALRWLEEQRLAGATRVTVRIVAQVEGAGDTLFAWDSGAGPISRGRPPVLTLLAGSAPPTPPPVPTENLLVATFTPAPLNLVTVVAQQATATFIAQTIGTYTPEPPFATPTPYARSLSTAEAIARDLGLPAVVLETPVPANGATATANAAYATAVALTTGTYTPVPTAYVTPFLVAPPLPSGRDDEDEQALRRMLEGTPLPYNAVIGRWVAATPTPQSVETAAARIVQATTDAALYGPATPTPWEMLVYTPVPPTPTPTIPLVQDVAAFTPTPELIPTATPPAVLPDTMRNRVLFLSDRYGEAETLAWDPGSGNISRINAAWAMPLAARQLGVSPDGQSVAIVKADDQRIEQIFVRSLVYGTETKITNFTTRGSETSSYDPDWSPTGEWIAFVSNNSGNDEIYRVSPDGAVTEQLTFNDWEWDKHPSWSPDGSQIVFYTNRDTKRRQVWVMNADGSNQRPLFVSEGHDWDPIWTR